MKSTLLEVALGTAVGCVFGACLLALSWLL